MYYDPPPNIDYTSHTVGSYVVREYVEQNVNIENLVNLCVSNIPIGRRGRLLDIGCGFGFAADAARRLRGWEVIGVEPSDYGRIGGDALNIPIVNEFVSENHSLAQQRFNLIVASHVIEHIQEPTAFITLLRSMLDPNGVLAIDVPSASALSMGDISNASRLGILSPGAHVTIFSAAGLRAALEAAGFACIEIDAIGNSAISARAGNHPLPPKEKTDSAAICIDYLKIISDTNSENEPLCIGANSRLYRLLVSHGRYAEANAVLARLPERAKAFKIASTYAQLMELMSPATAVNLFYIAMQKLNHDSEPETAALLFEQSFTLCAQRIKFIPGNAAVETGILWQAAFHAALANERAGRPGEAFWLATRIDFPHTEWMPKPRERELQRFAELKARVAAKLVRPTKPIRAAGKKVSSTKRHRGDSLRERPAAARAGTRIRPTIG